MALLHRATLQPTKLELLAVWLPDRPWSRVHQVPLTYRDAPLDGGDRWLIGTTEHSVLGRRWVYDACGDPVYAATLAGAILTGTGQAEEFLDVDGRLERREPAMTVTGNGTGEAPVPAVNRVLRVDEGDPTRVETDSVTLAVLRVLDGAGVAGGPVLTGSWPGADAVPLAYLAA